jgi:hypothetical protein
VACAVVIVVNPAERGVRLAFGAAALIAALACVFGWFLGPRRSRERVGLVGLGVVLAAVSLTLLGG